MTGPSSTPQLTEEQSAALAKLLAAVDAKQHISLQGPAGSGKTFLTGTLIRALLDQGRRVMCAAPTHKAVGVLQSRLPEGVRVTTIASLLGLKRRQVGQWVEFVPDFDAAKKRGQLRGQEILVLDECSMLSEQLGRELEKLADSFGVVIVAIGDQSQLPPVDPPPDPDSDRPASEHRGVMAQLFLDPPGGVVRLEKVVRHQGPVLELARKIRLCTDRSAVDALWPTASATDDDSRIVVHSYPNSWFSAAKRVFTHPRWKEEPDLARIVCWTNAQCNALTESIRKAQHGNAATRGWLVGEIVQNGDAIPAPGSPKDQPLAPSTCEWRITKARHFQLQQTTGHGEWHTPKRREARKFEIGCNIPAQRLRLEPLSGPAHLTQIDITVAIPGDTSWSDQLKAIKAQILKMPAGSSKNRAWAQWHELLTHVADLRSAAVLTTHRSQGSTFSLVFVAPDLSRCNTSDAVALHYTALTRASTCVHLIKRGAQQ